MKYKGIMLTITATIIFSCASKSSVPTAEVKKEEVKVESKPTAPIKNTVMTAELAEGKSLYENNCGKCHYLHNTNEFSSNDWKPIVARMLKKAQLDDLQGQKIYNYVTMK
jgi:cytochrome c5